ncbi:DHHC palmitoyltransferase-domain-containing protein [Infundibulicybe gibba]|nr:DHHC palmitoyltransferase-domain-containing protein [Infundibulicybe gibba]
MVQPKPLLSFSPGTNPMKISSSDDASDVPRRRWYHYLPLCGTVFLIFAPQPSLLYVLVDFHLQTLHRPYLFAIHLLVTCTLTFMAVSSLIVCVVRDPGPVSIDSNVSPMREGEDIELSEALMNPEDDLSAPGRWCRKCWAPKPERTHHCSYCGRCVLKMADHHCPWLGSRCVGHRTYPAFVHFLFSVTLLAAYVAIVMIFALWYAFSNPLTVNETIPVHELLLASAGIIFTLVIGPFFLYHVYLISTNQTTLESMSPFLLLRHLTPLPRAGHDLSDPPIEPELSYPQRRIVKRAHKKIRLYDIGWRKNWAQVFGLNRKYGLLYRLWLGGSSPGDGRHFPRNPRSEELLAKLATALVEADKDS